MKYIADYVPEINVTDKINGDESLWKPGDIILINAGTGSGKSYFIRNTLEPYAESRNKNILLLVNRKRLFQQSVKLIDEAFGWRIKIELYQTIENKINNGEGYDFTPYEYIVCDEAHYFTSDSSFNDNSEDSYQAIMSANHATRIFMSATGTILFKHLKSDMWRKKLNKTNNKVWPPYIIKRDFNNIETLSFYDGDFANIERFIEKHLSLDDKVIYFSDNIENLFEQYLKKQDYSMFVCSDSNKKNKKYTKYIDHEKVNDMVQKNKFNCRYLFTTTVLDNGFDLKDEKIKLIVCDILDIDTMLQCIGRKRNKDKSDRVHIILLNHSNKQLYNLQLSFQKKIEEAKALLKDGVNGLNKLRGKYGRNNNYMIYDVQSPDEKNKAVKKVSHVKWLQAQETINRIKEMLDNNRETNRFREIEGKNKESDAYMMYIANLLNVNKFTVLRKQHKHEELCKYLDSIVGVVILTLSERQELIKKMDVQQKGKLLKSIDSLNSALKENDIPYYIKEFETTRRENGNKKKYKAAWKVMRLSDK